VLSSLPRITLARRGLESRRQATTYLLAAKGVVPGVRIDVFLNSTFLIASSSFMAVY